MATTTTDRRTVVGVFNTRAEAERAVEELRRAKFRDDEIGFVGKDHEGKTKGQGDAAGVGAATGAAVGAGAAALASLGMTFGVIPVIGPILAVGPLAAALLSAAGGAVAGGIVGGLVGLGIPEHEAKYYENELQAGRFLVTVKADARYDEAWAILHRMGAYNQGKPAAASAKPSMPVSAGTETGQRTINVHEEQLHAHKQPVQTGEVRVHKEVVTEHKTMEVPVKREEVVVERRAVAGQTAGTGAIHAGEEVRIPVHEEQVRMEKTPVLKEVVTVGKQQVQGTEQVTGDVRKEEVHVEQKGNVDVKARDTKKGNKP